jgi:hypothetical protein
MSQEAIEESELEDDEQDLLAAGRSYADAKEYTRAARLLLDCKSAKGKFMSLYFQFLASPFIGAAPSSHAHSHNVVGVGKESPARLA